MPRTHLGTRRIRGHTSGPSPAGATKWPPRGDMGATKWPPRGDTHPRSPHTILPQHPTHTDNTTQQLTSCPRCWSRRCRCPRCSSRRCAPACGRRSTWAASHSGCPSAAPRRPTPAPEDATHGRSRPWVAPAAPPQLGRTYMQPAEPRGTCTCRSCGHAVLVYEARLAPRVGTDPARSCRHSPRSPLPAQPVLAHVGVARAAMEYMSPVT